MNPKIKSLSFIVPLANRPPNIYNPSCKIIFDDYFHSIPGILFRFSIFWYSLYEWTTIHPLDLAKLGNIYKFYYLLNSSYSGLVSLYI
jgi:hypothetical protein